MSRLSPLSPFSLLLSPLLCLVLLLLLCLTPLLSLQTLAAASSSCPSACQRRASLNISPRGFLASAVKVALLSSSSAFCRRSCYTYYPNSTHYVFHSNGSSAACWCLGNCTRLTPGSTKAVVGKLGSCADVKCPVVCQGPLGSPFIVSPPAVATKTGIPREGDYQASKCRTFCKGKASYYDHGVDGICRCHKRCLATKEYPGIVPGRMGYIPACQQEAAP